MRKVTVREFEERHEELMEHMETLKKYLVAETDTEAGEIKEAFDEVMHTLNEFTELRYIASSYVDVIRKLNSEETER